MVLGLSGTRGGVPRGPKIQKKKKAWCIRPRPAAIFRERGGSRWNADAVERAAREAPPDAGESHVEVSPTPQMDVTH
jgi:hypothetical protein